MLIWLKKKLKWLISNLYYFDPEKCYWLATLVLMIFFKCSTSHWTPLIIDLLLDFPLRNIYSSKSCCRALAQLKMFHAMRIKLSNINCFIFWKVCEFIVEEEVSSTTGKELTSDEETYSVKYTEPSYSSSLQTASTFYSMSPNTTAFKQTDGKSCSAQLWNTCEMNFWSFVQLKLKSFSSHIDISLKSVYSL